MDHALRMAHRLDDAAAERGMAPEGRRRIARLLAAALELRQQGGVVPGHYHYLHPGRSALILLIDLTEIDPVTLGAAIAFDSERAEWVARAAAAADPPVAELLDALPRAGDEGLAEELVIADDAVRRAVLAERLDYLRHAHLWPDMAARARAHAETVSIYEPIAQRTHPTLARRYAWWCRMFAERHLAKSPPGD